MLFRRQLNEPETYSSIETLMATITDTVMATRAAAAEAEKTKAPSPEEEVLRKEPDEARELSKDSNDPSQDEYTSSFEQEALAQFLSQMASGPEEAADKTSKTATDPLSMLLAASQDIDKEEQLEVQANLGRRLKEKEEKKRVIVPNNPLSDEEHAVVFRRNRYLNPVTANKRRYSTREGLEESTVKIVRMLMIRGKSMFKEVFSNIGIDYRRAYDILNVLLSTPLITKLGPPFESNHPYQCLTADTPVCIVDPIDIETGEDEAVAVMDQFNVHRRMHDVLHNMLMDDDDTIESKAIVDSTHLLGDDYADPTTFVNNSGQVAPPMPPVLEWDWCRLGRNMARRGHSVLMTKKPRFSQRPVMQREQKSGAARTLYT
ncbi:hypothetical protein J8273_7892 [Carpediemonas membranifera]|uniref:E2F/DP family winged-helix DNA-binding domain-containing protein n=1 Tax=Carpediemonas membranifera TaxID=201153 RepID=A0A8J6APV3_9EUKA|nr:hypothetical protein J8273_7892 [Carpediemonas membranifera]|eukprot:KAG9390541.1 hypothetical protein J8273_7892 [Carpediemonas membranifera]